MRKKIFAVAAASLMLAAVAGGQADAGQASAKKVDYFKATVSPSKSVTSGTVLTSKGTGALHSTSYYCVIAAYSKTQSAADRSTLKVVKSTKAGKITCKVKYQSFKAKDGTGTVRHCPTTKADKKAGFKCGVAYADLATVGARSESVAAFTPKK